MRSDWRKNMVQCYTERTVIFILIFKWYLRYFYLEIWFLQFCCYLHIISEWSLLGEIIALMIRHLQQSSSDTWRNKLHFSGDVTRSDAQLKSLWYLGKWSDSFRRHYWRFGINSPSSSGAQERCPHKPEEEELLLHKCCV